MDRKKNIPLIYILGIPVIFMIANSISFLHFEILGSPFYVSVMIYPLIYLLTGLVVKRSSYKSALFLMLLGLMTQNLLSVMIWIIADFTNPEVVIYEFLSFLLCQIIFIYTYDFLIKIKKDSYVPIFLLILVIQVIDHAFFGPLVEGQLLSVSIIARVAYTVFIPVVLAKETSKLRS